MKISIKVNEKTNLLEIFVKSVLPKYLLSQFNKKFNNKRVLKINQEFKIDSRKILLFALKNLVIDEIDSSVYIITVNKNLKVNNFSIMGYLNLITYGNRTIKGYPILNKIFEETSNNINYLFGRWKDGYQIL